MRKKSEERKETGKPVKKMSKHVVHYSPDNKGIGVCGQTIQEGTNLPQYVTCKACKKKMLGPRGCCKHCEGF